MQWLCLFIQDLNPGKSRYCMSSLLTDPVCQVRSKAILVDKSQHIQLSPFFIHMFLSAESIAPVQLVGATRRVGPNSSIVMA